MKKSEHPTSSSSEGKASRRSATPRAPSNTVRGDRSRRGRAAWCRSSSRCACATGRYELADRHTRGRYAQKHPSDVRVALSRSGRSTPRSATARDAQATSSSTSSARSRTTPSRTGRSRRSSTTRAKTPTFAQTVSSASTCESRPRGARRRSARVDHTPMKREITMSGGPTSSRRRSSNETLLQFFEPDPPVTSTTPRSARS